MRPFAGGTLWNSNDIDLFASRPIYPVCVNTLNRFRRYAQMLLVNCCSLAPDGMTIEKMMHVLPSEW